MIIKKVDDKPMIIHTKEKTKIHMHENQDARIKGHNVYMVDHSPMRNHTAIWSSMNLSKQPAGLKLTSMSGEQTLYEATNTGSTGEIRTIT